VDAVKDDSGSGSSAFAGRTGADEPRAARAAGGLHVAGDGPCHGRVRLIFTLILSFLSAAPAAAQSGPGPTTGTPTALEYSGRATVVYANVAGLTPTRLVDVILPSSGGTRQKEAAAADIPDVLSAQLLFAKTEGAGSFAQSEASVANLALSAHGHFISADLLESSSRAECRRGGGVSLQGSSQVANLFIDGLAITATGEKNQTIPLIEEGVEVGRVIINEQKRSRSDNSGAIRVTALHVIVDGPGGGAPLADIQISFAKSDVVCPPAGGTTLEYSGRASVVRANVDDLASSSLVTVNLPSTGGVREKNLATAEVESLVTAQALHAKTEGTDDFARSEASVANLALDVLGHTVSADLIESESRAECRSGRVVLSGSSTLANLMIDGFAITATSEKNQTFPLLGPDETEVGRVIVNEQRRRRSDGFGQITVNAIHVVIDAAMDGRLADVIVSQAQSDLHNCF
jgi:hypothetical protein